MNILVHWEGYYARISNTSYIPADKTGLADSPVPLHHENAESAFIGKITANLGLDPLPDSTTKDI